MEGQSECLSQCEIFTSPRCESLASLRVYTERVAMASRLVPLSWSPGGIPELAVPELCLQKQDWGGGDFALKCTASDRSMTPRPFCLPPGELQHLLKRTPESRHTDIPTRSQAGEWGLGVILRSFYLLISPFQNLVVSGLSGLHGETLSQTNEQTNKQHTHHQPPPMGQRKIWKSERRTKSSNKTSITACPQLVLPPK